MSGFPCCCFSGEPLNEDEYGRNNRTNRGAGYEKIRHFNDHFQLSMDQACHKEIGCCLIGACPLTWCCVQYTMRYRVLNHVYPGSEWNNYLCTQGYCPGCCCWQPVHSLFRMPSLNFL